jgi:DNA-binding IclR family transcriptional regulator
MTLEKKDKSYTPALDAGLDIMEYLYCHKEAGFNELCRQLPVSRSSVLRILKTLAERGYVQKDEARSCWLPGRRMNFAGMNAPVADVMRSEAPRILGSFTDATACTVLCIYWNGNGFQVIAKEQREGGIVMLEVGSVIRDLSKYPWGWLFYLSLDTEERERFDGYMECPELIRDCPAQREKYFIENGFALDNEEVYKGRLRFAAPVRDGQGRITGALGTSCSSPLQTEEVQALGKELAKHADKLSDFLPRRINT